MWHVPKKYQNPKSDPPGDPKGNPAPHSIPPVQTSPPANPLSDHQIPAVDNSPPNEPDSNGHLNGHDHDSSLSGQPHKEGSQNPPKKKSGWNGHPHPRGGEEKAPSSGEIPQEEPKHVAGWDGNPIAKPPIQKHPAHPHEESHKDAPKKKPSWHGLGHSRPHHGPHHQVSGPEAHPENEKAEDAPKKKPSWHGLGHSRPHHQASHHGSGPEAQPPHEKAAEPSKKKPSWHGLGHSRPHHQASHHGSEPEAQPPHEKPADPPQKKPSWHGHKDGGGTPPEVKKGSGSHGAPKGPVPPVKEPQPKAPISHGVGDFDRLWKEQKGDSHNPQAGWQIGRIVFPTLCLLFLGFLMIVWGLYGYAEAWWPGTLILFAPRLVLLAPLILLGLGWFQYRSWLGFLTILVCCGLIWPLLGFNLPWKKWTEPKTEGEALRFITLNMHSSKEYPQELEKFLHSCEADVIAIQNWDASEKCLLPYVSGWFFHRSKAHFLLSRFPIHKAIDLGDHSRGEKGAVFEYDLAGPDGIIHVLSIHMATNREGIRSLMKMEKGGSDLVEENSKRRLRQAKHLHSLAILQKDPTIIMGDFNTPVDSPNYSHVWGHFQNAFNFAGFGCGFTFFGDSTMVRIDHILTSSQWAVQECTVGPKVGSPHRPLIAELILKKP